MKHTFTLLAFFLSLISLNASNEKKELKATFDFSNPTQLTPSFTLTAEDMNVSVDNVTFTEGNVKCVAKRKTVQNTASPHLLYHKMQPPFEDYIQLYLEAGNVLEVSVPNQYEITKLYFDEGSNKVGTLIVDGTPGTYSPNHVWTNTDSSGAAIDGITKVRLYNTKDCAFINSVIIEYRSPLNVLELPSVTPKSTDEIYELGTFNLDFSTNIASIDDSNIVVKNTLSQTVSEVSCVANGNSVACTLANTIKTPGSYTVTFPTGCFVDVDGYYNKEFIARFTVSIEQDTFNPTSELTQEVEMIPATFTVAFPSTIGKVNVKNIQLMKQGETDVKALVNGSINSDNHAEVSLNLTPDMPITEKGIYTITIPEGSVRNIYTGMGVNNGERYNQEFTLTFKVAGADAPSEETIEEAQYVLGLTGVGYASEDAEARLALEEMLQLMDKGDSEFRVAIDNLYATTDIQMPESGKYYKVSNVSRDGNHIYLAYDNESVTYTNDINNAYSFGVTTTDDGYELTTQDGKYLTVLMNSDDYSLCKKTSVSDNSYDLVLERFNATDVADKDTYGMFSIKGNVGKFDGVGEDIIAYSTLRTTDNTPREAQTTTLFSSSYSSAFMLIEAEKPAIITEAVVTVYPEGVTIESLDRIEVVFPTVSNVSVDNNKIYLVSDNVVYAPTSVSVSGTNSNKVTAQFGILVNGTYNFVAEEGAFTYFLDSETVKVQALSKEFTVYLYDEFITDIRDIYTLVGDQSFFDGPHNAADYNNISFHLTKKDNVTPVPVFVNSNIKIEVYNNTLTHVTDGHLEKFTTSDEYEVEVLYKGDTYIGLVSTSDANTATVDGIRYWYVEGYEKRTETRTRVKEHFKVVLDTPLSASNCPGKDLQFYFNEAAFGDVNYGLYLANPGSVAKRDCHVNAKFSLPYDVDNSHTGIENVLNSEKKSVIFDLSGRRVENMSTPGIYIINGKKYLRK